MRKSSPHRARGRRQSVVTGTGKLTARAAAALAVGELTGAGASLDAVLPAVQERVVDGRDRALARELAAGVARWYFQLASILDRLTPKPLKNGVVRAVVLCGIYQLRYLRIPPHAAISESVETVRQLGQPRAAALVNAVLRRYQREADALSRNVESEITTRLSYPEWMVNAFAGDWPDDVENLLHAGNQRAPQWLRVNRRRTDTAGYAALLAEQTGEPVEQSPFAPAAVRPRSPLSVSELPGFADGMVSVQDAGAQLAAELMSLRDGMRVLDACAAPGGKSCHLLERADIALTAIDNDAARLERVHDNLQRLGLAATVVEGDAANPSGWWDGKPYDRILLDVPCSATGVIRRHPDIKLLRRDSDIGELASRQRSMLEAVWPLLAPGGRLLYATCSVLRAENAAVVERFLSGDTGAKAVDLNVQWGRKCGPGRQILTGEAAMDGFYYSCLEAG